jgi:hypothetical protein
MSEAAREHDELGVRGENEIIVVPVAAVVRNGDTIAAVHGDLPRPHRLI